MNGGDGCNLIKYLSRELKLLLQMAIINYIMALNSNALLGLDEPVTGFHTMPDANLYAIPEHPKSIVREHIVNDIIQTPPIIR